MPKRRTAAKRQTTRSIARTLPNGQPAIPTSSDAIVAAEQVALQAFASGLKLAAAFGSAAAKTTSLALASLATGADKFSELVREETLRSASRKTRNNIQHRPSRIKERPS